MTAKPVAPKIRPIATVFEIERYDAEGRLTVFRLQVGNPAHKIGCWTDLDNGGSITIEELFAHCAQAKARGESR